MQAIILDHKNIGKFYAENYLISKKHFYKIVYKGEQIFFPDYSKATIFSSRFCPLAKIEISK